MGRLALISHNVLEFSEHAVGPRSTLGILRVREYESVLQVFVHGMALPHYGIHKRVFVQIYLHLTAV